MRKDVGNSALIGILPPCLPPGGDAWSRLCRVVAGRPLHVGRHAGGAPRHRSAVGGGGRAGGRREHGSMLTSSCGWSPSSPRRSTEGRRTGHERRPRGARVRAPGLCRPRPRLSRGRQGSTSRFSSPTRALRGFLLPGRAGRTEYDDAANVVGAVEGTSPTDSTIVVTAHYDHLGVQNGVIYPGADDNASGVAALLAIARYVKTHPLRHDILFVAFDAEELDLAGAKAFLARPPKPIPAMALNVNLDMVSRNDRNRDLRCRQLSLSLAETAAGGRAATFGRQGSPRTRPAGDECRDGRRLDAPVRSRRLP